VRLERRWLILAGVLVLCFVAACGGSSEEASCAIPKLTVTPTQIRAAEQVAVGIEGLTPCPADKEGGSPGYALPSNVTNVHISIGRGMGPTSTVVEASLVAVRAWTLGRVDFTTRTLEAKADVPVLSPGEYFLFLEENNNIRSDPFNVS
jgi:hypothetical protein